MITRATAVGFKGLEFTHRLKKRKPKQERYVTSFAVMSLSHQKPHTEETKYPLWLLLAFASHRKRTLGFIR